MIPVRLRYDIHVLFSMCQGSGSGSAWWIRIIFRSWIRISMKVKFKKLQRLKIEPWRYCTWMPTMKGLEPQMESWGGLLTLGPQIPITLMRNRIRIRVKVKSLIRIRIKVRRIRNQWYVPYAVSVNLVHVVAVFLPKTVFLFVQETFHGFSSF